MREAETKQNPTVQKLLKAYKNANLDSVNVTDSTDRTIRNGYLGFLKAIKGIDYSAADVTLFCLELVIRPNSFERNNLFKAGIFISALVNSSGDHEFLVGLPGEKPLNCLGYRNTKRINVNYDVGEYCGNQMLAGEISVNGNAGESAGASMHGGRIHIMGNASGSAGMDMKGGTIIIDGDCFDDTIGAWAQGGVIEINGKFEAFTRSCKARILHNGTNITRTVRRNNKFD